MHSLDRQDPYPGMPASSSSSSEYAFLSRRHLPRGIGCHTVAQTQPPKLDPAKKNTKIGPGKRTPKLDTEPISKRRLGSGIVKPLFISSSHMVQLSDHQHDLNVCQQRTRGGRPTFIG